MNGLRSLLACRLGWMSQSTILSRVLALASRSSKGRSMTSLMRSSFESYSRNPLPMGEGAQLRFDSYRTSFHLALGGERKPRKCFKRIVGTHARNDLRRQMRRYRVITVELPVRIIGCEQEHPV